MTSLEGQPQGTSEVGESDDDQRRRPGPLRWIGTHSVVRLARATGGGCWKSHLRYPLGAPNNS